MNKKLHGNTWKRIGLLILVAAALFFTQAGGLSALADSEVCAHAHTETEGAAEATCRETGYTGDLVCLDCGAVLEYGEEIPLEDHTWDEGTVTREADCTTAGSVTYTCTVCGSVKVEAVSALGHDYKITEYVAPKGEEDGYALYECTRCGDVYTQEFSATGEEDTDITYGSFDDATSDSLTFYVGYFGMSYIKKTTVSLSEMVMNLPLVTQTFSYINQRPRVVYDQATGPLFLDVLYYAGIDITSIDRFRFGTADSGGTYFGGEYTYDLVFQERYFFPSLSLYFTGDDSNGYGFSDSLAAEEGMEIVEPMLAIWDTWMTYDLGQEYSASNHTDMRTSNCFRLLYGQTEISEIDAVSSAKYLTAVYVQYSGSPTVDAGDDLELEVSDDYVVTANVSSVDDTLTEAFQNAIVWSSSDESVVTVDASTGQITVVGEGTAEITATAEKGGLTISDSLTVTVTAGDEEDLDGGGGAGDLDEGGSDEEEPDSGAGTGGGSGSGTGSGEGTGSGDGSGTGTGAGSSLGTDDGSGSDTGDGSGAADTGSDGSDSESTDTESTDLSVASAKSSSSSKKDASQDSVSVVSTDELPESLVSVDVADAAEELKSSESTDEDTGILVRGVSVGEDGGGGGAGEEKAVLLTMTEDVNMLAIGIFAVGFFAVGCVIMLIKYKREF